MLDLKEVNTKMPQSATFENLKNKLEPNKPLAPFSTFKTGGPAQWFILADSVELLSDAIKMARAEQLNYVVIGGGSNLLISDDGFDGLVIKVALKGIQLIDKTQIDCFAGEDLMALIRFAEENGLTGLEFASGIAGTVGGAIYGNAGAYGGEIKDVLTEVTLVDCEGNIKKVNPAYCKFRYRDSYLKKSKEIVARASFKLEKGNKESISKKIEEILTTRAGKHPVDGKTAGSFFKNIPDPKEPYGKLAAGKLLEEAGAKQLSVGDAAVYEKHANMIINRDNATSKDIRELADMMKKIVFEKFGIELEEEVITIGKI